ncbi:MAG: hypothetical protein NZO16_05830, partial [Deltaproteobacteria bacterium]|nr:hypothetical protein [Deltaproteobacteria bacterium]
PNLKEPAVYDGLERRKSLEECRSRYEIVLANLQNLPRRIGEIYLRALSSEHVATPKSEKEYSSLRDFLEDQDIQETNYRLRHFLDACITAYEEIDPNLVNGYVRGARAFILVSLRVLAPLPLHQFLLFYLPGFKKSVFSSLERLFNPNSQKSEIPKRPLSLNVLFPPGSFRAPTFEVHLSQDLAYGYLTRIINVSSEEELLDLFNPMTNQDLFITLADFFNGPLYKLLADQGRKNEKVITRQQDERNHSKGEGLAVYSAVQTLNARYRSLSHEERLSLANYIRDELVRCFNFCILETEGNQKQIDTEKIKQMIVFVTQLFLLAALRLQYQTANGLKRFCPDVLATLQGVLPFDHQYTQKMLHTLGWPEIRLEEAPVSDNRNCDQISVGEDIRQLIFSKSRCPINNVIFKLAFLYRIVVNRVLAKECCR